MKRKGFTLEYAVLLGLFLLCAAAHTALMLYPSSLAFGPPALFVWLLLFSYAAHNALLLILAIRCQLLPYLPAAALAVAGAFLLARLLTRLLRGREWAVFHILLGLWLLWWLAFLLSMDPSHQRPPVSYLPFLAWAGTASAVYWLIFLVSRRRKPSVSPKNCGSQQEPKSR